MLRNVILFVILSVSVTGYAQQTVEISDKYAPDVIQKYHVLSNNSSVKQGLYQALYKKKTVIASGNYTQGKRNGIWHFYDRAGNVVQNYNYDTRSFISVAQEDTAANIVRYDFVPKPLVTDRITMPVKIGGLLYGYLPYLTKFKVDNTAQYNPNSLFGIMELLVSPNGRLAECTLTVKYETMLNMNVVDRILNTYNLSPELLNDDDKQFLPATVNQQPVSSSIYIYCIIDPNGKIRMF